MAELWAISVRGPDDLIAAPDAIAAHLGAQRINEGWCKRIVAKGLHEFDPHMWASPVLWPYTEPHHAEALARGPGDYAGVFDDPATIAA